MRTLVESGSKCSAHAHYAYVVKAGPRVCCTGNSPEALCAECRAAVTVKPTIRPSRTELPPVARQHQGADGRVYGRGPVERKAETVPPAPSLKDAIRGARARGEGLVVLPSQGVNRYGVPDAPRLARG